MARLGDKYRGGLAGLCVGAGLRYLPVYGESVLQQPSVRRPQQLSHIWVQSRAFAALPAYEEFAESCFSEEVTLSKHSLSKSCT